MKEKGVRMLVVTFPQQFERPLGSGALEAMTLAVLGKRKISDSDYLNVIEQLNLEPDVTLPQGRMIEKRKNRLPAFAEASAWHASTITITSTRKCLTPDTRNPKPPCFHGNVKDRGVVSDSRSFR